jgi:D-sedoheptulose 7-phosphate isomerase
MTIVAEDQTLSEVTELIDDGIRAIEFLHTPSARQFISDLANLLTSTFKSGNKIIIAGNGGSLCDAAHFAEELTGFFRRKRKALPAIALSEPGHMSCTGNDLGFDYIFSRGVEAYGKRGDVFIGLTTSGNSPNIINAFESAQTLGLTTVAFLGKTGGALRDVADLELLVEGFSTSDRIQEAHMTAIHISIELMERQLFADAGER